MKGTVFMKKFTVITSFLLIVIMTVTLAACTVTSSSAGILGNWKSTFDIGKIASAMPMDSSVESMKGMYESIMKAYDGVSVDIRFDLTEDKKAKMYFDEASAEKVKSKIKENLKGLLPELFKSFGVDDYKSALEGMGLSEDQFIDNNLNSIDLSQNFEGTYKVDGNKLYLTQSGEEENTDNYFVFEQNGNELKITDAQGSGTAMISSEIKDALLPLVFTRL